MSGRPSINCTTITQERIWYVSRFGVLQWSMVALVNIVDWLGKALLTVSSDELHTGASDPKGCSS